MRIFHLDHDNADFSYTNRRVADFLGPFTIEYENPESGLIDGIYCHSRHDYLIYDCLVDLVTGLVFIDGGLIAESSPWPEANLRLSLSRYNKLVPLRSRLASSSHLTNIIPSTGFYHWLVEQLPVILHQRDLMGSDVKFVIHEHAPKYVLDLVSMLNLNVHLSPRFVKFPEFMLTSFAPTTGWPSHQEISLVRSLIPEKLRVPEEKLNVYVSRRRASRSPFFEAKLEDDLASLGWKIIHNEDLSLQDQIQMYAQASTIVGVHGAGLASQVWMQNRGRVIELSPPETRNSMANLANELGNEFNRLKIVQESSQIGSTHEAIRDQIVSLL
jgi:hypothetical protein